MRSSLTCVLEEPSGGDACVHQHQHVPTDLREQAVRSMHFRDLVAIDLQAHYHMRTTLGQQDTAYLRISPRPVLVAAATKGQCVGLRVGGVEERAIDGHEPIATKEGIGHSGVLGRDLTALAHQGLEALAAQFLAASTQSRITDRTLWLGWMEIAELAHQALPDLALVATAPQRHGEHKQHQGQGRTDRKSTRLNSSHLVISYAVFCLKKKKHT